MILVSSRPSPGKRGEEVGLPVGVAAREVALEVAWRATGAAEPLLVQLAQTHPAPTTFQVYSEAVALPAQVNFLRSFFRLCQGASRQRGVMQNALPRF